MESSLTSREKRYPHIFLDKNAVVKLCKSLTCHLRADCDKKTLVRFLLECELISFITVSNAISTALSVPARDYPSYTPLVQNELNYALERNWIILIDSEHNLRKIISGPVRNLIAQKLGSYWSNLLSSIDPEDAELLEWAAKAYALSCLVRTHSGYTSQHTCL